VSTFLFVVAVAVLEIDENGSIARHVRGGIVGDASLMENDGRPEKHVSLQMEGVNLVKLMKAVHLAVSDSSNFSPYAILPFSKLLADSANAYYGTLFHAIFAFIVACPPTPNL
jgi:hypothetical protein